MERDYIIASIRPFVINQKIGVYLNGECVEALECKIDDIEKTISALVDKYKVNQIDLVEKNNMYSPQIKDRLTTKYADKELNINIW